MAGVVGFRIFRRFTIAWKTILAQAAPGGDRPGAMLVYSAQRQLARRAGPPYIQRWPAGARAAEPSLISAKTGERRGYVPGPRGVRFPCLSGSALDLAVIAAYLLGIVAVGCYAGLKRRQEGEANRYFLAAHSLRWPSIGMALFATNISCLHLVSLAQAGYDSGLLMGNFEWMAGFTLVLLSLFFVPFYIRSKVATLPDFLEKRYCRECRDWLAVVSMVAAIVFHIAFPLSSGWIVLHGVFGIEKWTCIFADLRPDGPLHRVGRTGRRGDDRDHPGDRADPGAVIITAFAYAKVGGWDQMVHALQSTNETFRLSVLRSGAVEKEFPWFAIFLGYPVLGSGIGAPTRRSCSACSAHRTRTTPASARCSAP